MWGGGRSQVLCGLLRVLTGQGGLWGCLGGLVSLCMLHFQAVLQGGDLPLQGVTLLLQVVPGV